MAIDRDKIEPGEGQRELLAEGFYCGHAWGVKKLSGISEKNGKPWANYTITYRLTHDVNREALERPVRVYQRSVWPPQAAALTSRIGNPMNGQPVMIEVKHSSYLADTGDIQLDADFKPKIDPRTGEVVPVMEKRTTLEVTRVGKDEKGKVLTIEQMEEIETRERPVQTSGGNGDEAMPEPGEDLPF